MDPQGVIRIKYIIYYTTTSFCPVKVTCCMVTLYLSSLQYAVVLGLLVICEISGGIAAAVLKDKV